MAHQVAKTAPIARQDFGANWRFLRVQYSKLCQWQIPIFPGSVQGKVSPHLCIFGGILTADF